jgi:hypothetical protein
MKITEEITIFLDIDGVLNNEVWGQEYGYGGFFEGEPTINGVNWCPHNVYQFVEFLSRFENYRIVISSTWRLEHNVEAFKKMFALYTREPINIVGITGVAGYDGLISPYTLRGIEIEDYFKKNPTESYLIIDDMNQFFPHQQKYFMKIDPKKGFLLP